MKYYIVMVLVLLSTVGCAQKNYRDTVGFNGIDHVSGIETLTELQNDDLYIFVHNPQRVSYQVWVVYKLKSKIKNSRVEERIHEGKSLRNNFVVAMPNDKDESTRESVQLFVTSSEVYDIDKIVELGENAHHINGDVEGSMVTVKGLSIMTRRKYFQTPEVVLNGFDREGSYGNSLQQNFNLKEN